MRLEIKPEFAYSSQRELRLHITGNEFAYLTSVAKAGDFDTFRIKVVSARRAVVEPKRGQNLPSPVQFYETVRKHFEVYVPFGGKKFMIEEKIQMAGTPEGASHGWDFRQWNWEHTVKRQESRKKRAALAATQAAQESGKVVSLASKRAG